MNPLLRRFLPKDTPTQYLKLLSYERQIGVMHYLKNPRLPYAARGIA